jgi:hypothetical protein
LRLERARRRRLLVECHGKTGLAVVVGVRQAFKRMANCLDVLVGEPELIAGKARPFARGGDDHLAFELEFGSRRAIQKTPLDRDLGCARLGDAFGLGAEFEFDPIGHVVLDEEGRLADWRALRIGEGPNAPGASRSRRHQRHRQRASAQTLIGNDGAAVFDAVRPLDHQGERHIERGHALAVAQERRHLYRLPGAIDPALGIDESVETGRHRAA